MERGRRDLEVRSVKPEVGKGGGGVFGEKRNGTGNDRIVGGFVKFSGRRRFYSAFGSRRAYRPWSISP
jgi:hypothetical protein